MELNCVYYVLLTDESSVEQEKKKGIVVSARVHPGETNSSWMMKGLLEFITGTSTTARVNTTTFVILQLHKL